MDNRPEDFVGLYAERAVIGLPPNWFSGPSMQLVGENILIGTGGFSGTIGMETVGETLWANIGGENGFRVGFDPEASGKNNLFLAS